jgi:hypothetical protein
MDGRQESRCISSEDGTGLQRVKWKKRTELLPTSRPCCFQRLRQSKYPDLLSHVAAHETNETAYPPTIRHLTCPALKTDNGSLKSWCIRDLSFHRIKVKVEVHYSANSLASRQALPGQQVRQKAPLGSDRSQFVSNIFACHRHEAF